MQGIPEARDDHAVVMVRFARNILRKFARLTKELEVSLGPDTGDLSLRIGVHSGPVTAVRFRLRFSTICQGLWLKLWFLFYRAF